MGKKIQDIKKYVSDLLANGKQVEYYAKTARISARPGVVGEKIVTTLANGHQETINVAKAGDMVATNPGGEQYVISAETFKKKYEIDPNNPKVYRPKGGAQQFLRLDDIFAEHPANLGLQIVANIVQRQVDLATIMFANDCDCAVNREEKLQLGGFIRHAIIME